jgi:FkbM family methyltransferase
MPGARSWVASLLLRTPESLRSIRNVPVLGDFVHRLSHRVLRGEEKVWVQIEAGPSKGLWIGLNPRTGQSYLRGEAEPALQKVIAEGLRPGSVFYDLGANIGLFSLLAARLVGPTGRVFSFEPDAEIARRLRGNIERNAFANVTVVQKGVWSSSGQKEFMGADRSSPDHGTGTFMTSAKPPSSTKVECVALDDFVRTALPPDGIKCDVEGAEAEVLRGATNLLAARRPWILCELHGAANDRTCRELLAQFAYSFDALDSHHLLATPQGA